jgi:hypothetical protein
MSSASLIRINLMRSAFEMAVNYRSTHALIAGTKALDIASYTESAYTPTDVEN